MGELTNEQIKKVIDCACLYEDLDNNVEIATINLIEDLRLSNNVHETAHSRLLCKLLQVCKNQEISALKLFLEVVKFPVQSADLKNVGFYREKKNIDILITFGEIAIIIENKINKAEDQKKQLERYYNTLQDGLRLKIKGRVESFKAPNIYIYYLPPYIDDSEPSQDSINPIKRKELEKGEHYKKISFEKEIREWMCKCKRDLEVPEGIKPALSQYCEFIDNMFEPKKIEEIKMSLENVYQALGLENKTLEEKIGTIGTIRPSLELLLKAINDGERYAFILELKKKYNIEATITPHVPKTDNDYKVDFLVTFDGKEYKGFANVFRNEDFGYWFGLWADERISIDDKTIKEATRCEIIKEDEENSNKNEDELEKYKTCYKSSVVGLYAYWKYCDPKLGIDNMIDEIAHYVEVLRNA